jgi:hypothetical protein
MSGPAASNPPEGDRVEQRPLHQLLRYIADTQEEELSCEECFALGPEYVEREIAGSAADERWSRLSQHLRQCRVCREEYEVLRDLARLEVENRFPPEEDLRRSL